MANPERGEVAFVTATKEYTLALTMSALCEMQSMLSKTYLQILVAIGSVDVIAIETYLWCCLKKYHGKEFPKRESLHDLIDNLPRGLQEAYDVVNDVVELNRERGKKKAGTTDPPKAESLVGATST